MWFRRDRRPPPDIREGASFHRVRGFHIVETARIIDVVKDPLGIPHVRFQLRIACPRAAADEIRTLSLESFRGLYREPAAEAA
jgi:hypothetical protein